MDSGLIHTGRNLQLLTYPRLAFDVLVQGVRGAPPPGLPTEVPGDLPQVQADGEYAAPAVFPSPNLNIGRGRPEGRSIQVLSAVATYGNRSTS